MEMVLGIPFFYLSNIDIEFVELEKLIWKTYIAVEALPTTSWVKLLNKREFAKTPLDENSKTFVMYIAALEISTPMSIYLS